jgi:hypothetical protein
MAVTEITLTSTALLKCGTEARETLRKVVSPRLKELKFHRFDQVRKSAETLQKKIDNWSSNY